MRIDFIKEPESHVKLEPIKLIDIVALDEGKKGTLSSTL